MAQTIILTEDWTMTTTGVEKNAGTEITFSSRSPEMRRILEADAGQPKLALPDDLPGRKHFLKAGYDSLQSLLLIDSWVDVKGIGEKTAEELDDYFKSKPEGE